MNVYVNARFLSQPITGVQRYAVELVKQWDRLLDEGEIDPGRCRFTLLAPPNILHEPELRRMKIERVGRLKGHAWEQFVLPYRARDGLLVNLCNTGPLAARDQIATIHDTAVYEHPASFTFAFRNAYKIIQNGLGRRARKIITVSQFSKSQLMQHCRVKEHKIHVVSLGKEHMQEVQADAGVYARHGLKPKAYILAVSSMNPYKNFAGIARAIELLGERDYEIVIAGARNAKVFGPMDMRGAEKIKWVGYVTDEELKALFEGAACFVFPSYYEGFGLPPLEAMACGAPILVSAAASMPEVCGDAGLYFDPHDPGDIARTIEMAMGDAELRQSLRESGYRRAAAFSWDRCARQTLDVIKEAVQR
ncbi:glycosyltransferase family 4 protein [Cohnella nanjingensis]|uniref:Glycosyltransferase family 4 protein n=1 Tax=Cohnella nanjingensis TaxID=1387779 RepID=A0A7X0RQJ6_9BACL|nr:glycosyltransferase family 1 protein [Cohnella nanjingensis]MBB6671721.1 glycosyltransferase family 4 protein [Cohnella nanjingensis]